jgi:hypothetical protein
VAQVSVILSTCDDPASLEKVVWGYFKQSYQDFELIVADDGLGPDLSVCLPRLQRDTALKIRHLRDESSGGCKCAVLNSAIEQAAGSYLVFSEDRCIPRWDFLEVHVRLARPRRFLSGASVSLPALLSRQIAREDVIAGRATDARWLIQCGLGKQGGIGAIAWSPRWAGLFDAVSTPSVTWNSANASCWKSDLMEVNGFDERIECGILDRELGDRLRNAGVRGKQVRHRAVCVRLYCPNLYLPRQALERNLTLSSEIRRTRSTWTPFGIRKGFRVFGLEEPSPADSDRARRAVA